jgi:hypothetical protein
MLIEKCFFIVCREIIYVCEVCREIIYACEVCCDVKKVGKHCHRLLHGVGNKGGDCDELDVVLWT